MHGPRAPDLRALPRSPHRQRPVMAPCSSPARNLRKPEAVRAAGLVYVGIGR